MLVLYIMSMTRSLINAGVLSQKTVSMTRNLTNAGIIYYEYDMEFNQCWCYIL